MSTSFTQYHATLAAMIAIGALMLLQLIVADLAAIRAKHKAGTPIPPDFSKFYFRAARAHANTNESVAVFLALTVAGLFAAASPYWLGLFAWAYVACRVAHMVAYYANQKLARSTSFGLSLLMLLGLLVVSASALLLR